MNKSKSLLLGVFDSKLPKLRGCLVALLIVVIASLIRAAFFAELGRGIPYITYYPAAMLAALFGGLIAGLLATGISAFLCFFWIQQGYMSHVETLAFTVFVISCIMISLITEAMYQAKNQASLAKKNLEQQVDMIREANAHLQTEVVERKQAEQKIELANKELEAFSYSVSHDLRAPLRGINGFAQILLEDFAPELNDEAKRVCSVIMENSQKMGHLIDDLLAFSRLSRADMQLSDVDMKTLVNSLYYEITDAQSHERIELRIDDICDSMGDPTMLRQVWTNLLSNAVKYSSRKEKAIISVTCKKEMTRNIYCIKDNGVGFDMRYENKLFGVFQRIHSTKDFEGTGVGLAIVQRIIARHGGEVWAEGEVDKGAAFYFSLPLLTN